MCCKQKELLKSNTAKTRSVALGQRADSARARLEGMSDWKAVGDESDATDLLRMIRKVAFSFESQKSGLQSAHEQVRKRHADRQGKAGTVQEHLEKFSSRQEVAIACGGKLALQPRLVSATLRERSLTRATAAPEQIAPAETA